MATAIHVFDKWKEFLGDKVNQAERMGMSEDAISRAAFHIGEFLSDKIDPENKEERVLKELWDSGDDEEKRVVAKLMVRLVDKG